MWQPAFFDELVKISRAVTESEVTKALKAEGRKQKAQKAALLGGAAGVAGGIGARTLGQIGGLGATAGLIGGEQGLSTSPEDIERLQKAITKKPYVHKVPFGSFAEARYAPGEQVLPEASKVLSPEQFVQARKEGIVIAPQQAGSHVTAHELGHARFGQGRVGKVLQNMPLRLGKALPYIRAAPAAASVVADPESGISKAMPYVGAATIAPELISEGVASYHGLKGMRQAGYSPAARALARKQLLKAFGTYALPLTAIGVGAPMAARALKKRTQKAVMDAPE